MTMGCPISSDIAFAMVRAIKSDPPPAGKPTIQRIGLDGYLLSCAVAELVVKAARLPRTRGTVIQKRFVRSALNI
jgi:hypothetical protein